MSCSIIVALKFLQNLWPGPLVLDNQGKQQKRYPYHQMMTPYEKFKSLPQAPRCRSRMIVTHISGLPKQLDDIAGPISDNEAAKQLKEAKQQLFKTITEQENRAA